MCSGYISRGACPGVYVPGTICLCVARLASAPELIRLFMREARGGK